MKIYFPVAQNNGLESWVFEHFDSAPMFLLVDAETGEVSKQFNRDKDRDQGDYEPFNFLAEQTADAIVVGEVGKDAFSSLNKVGLKVFQAEFGSVAKNLSLITNGQLFELTRENICNNHDSSHKFGCGF